MPPSISMVCLFTSVSLTDLEMPANCSKISRKESQFHAIEIMSCPGGCIGGGGQPYHHGNAEILKKRQLALYREDSGKSIRKSHENPYITKLYEEFLGAPMSEKSHHLL